MSKLRYYHGTDANFIVTTGHSIQLINEKHSDFEAFSIHFSPEGRQELNDLLDQASHIPTDNVFIDIQAKATNEVKIEHDKSCKFFQHSKFDIEMAFPNDKLVWNQFGFNDYEKARKSARNMFMFLIDFDMMATRYKDTLTTNGWDEAKFISILEHRDKLKTAMNSQNDSIVERRKATENRMIVLNNLYEKIALYFKAAQIIYDGDEDLLKRFKFPAPNPSAKADDIEEDILEEETNN
jgi:hypothetical protein